ncbi:MAG: energy-coupling factor ABC transporter ATP-binding protein [Nitrososphaerales archaeon]
MSQESRVGQNEIIAVNGFSFRYYGSNQPVLQNVDFRIHAGEIVVIAGKSGSGKSTLLRAINGLIPHQHTGDYSGSVIVDGLQVASTRMSELATKVGYIFQNPENQIFMFSVERDIGFGLENLGVERNEIRQRVDWAMEMLGIKHLALRAPHELSDGQKQRVAIAGVIAMRPRILILDEPTSLLDPHTARDLVKLVKELHDKLGITVLIVEHRLDLVAQIANRVIVLDEGKVVHDGKTRQVLYDSEISLFGVTEPTIVRLAKLLPIERRGFPISAVELLDQLKRRTN